MDPTQMLTFVYLQLIFFILENSLNKASKLNNIFLILPFWY